MKEYETKEEALVKLNELTREFLAMPTPEEYRVLETKEQEIAKAKIIPLGVEIREISRYIQEKWGENK